MKTKHTPGPWQYGDLCEELFHLQRVGNSVVTEVICTRPAVEPPSGPTDQQWEANVRLIASAPEMLKALQAIKDRCGASGESKHDRLVWTIADTAIAKAEGR